MDKQTTKFKSARVAAGLSQSQLAKLVGVTDGIISMWERGLKVPTKANLQKLKEVLRVSADDLLDI